MTVSSSTACRGVDTDGDPRRNSSALDSWSPAAPDAGPGLDHGRAGDAGQRGQQRDGRGRRARHTDPQDLTVGPRTVAEPDRAGLDAGLRGVHHCGAFTTTGRSTLRVVSAAGLHTPPGPCPLRDSDYPRRPASSPGRRRHCARPRRACACRPRGGAPTCRASTSTPVQTSTGPGSSASTYSPTVEGERRDLRCRGRRTPDAP